MRVGPERPPPRPDAAHGMMAGGRWATTGAGATPWYRLWFRRNLYQRAGFRPVRSLAGRAAG